MDETKLPDPEDLQPVAAGQKNVEQDHVRRMADGARNRFARRPCALDLTADRSEHQRSQLEEVLFVKSLSCPFQ